MDRVVVFARHRTPIEILTAGLPDAVAVHGGTSQKHRDEIISEFRHGSSIKSLVLQLEIGNAGIQLVSASNVVFAELPWTPHSVEQAIARLHRQGQQRNVLARMFSLQGSFDQTVGRVLERKLKTTTSFNTALTTKSPKIAL
jgi:SWI/SNF-related matrix-associated actin-dependent regulator 1 of chromatin subfamily A